MVDDRALVLPQQETEALKEVHLGYLSRWRLSRMSWGHVWWRMTSSVPFLFARDTPDLSSASEVGVRGGRLRRYKASLLLSTEWPLGGRGF